MILSPSHTLINCMPLSKSLKLIKSHFILLNNNARKCTLYTIRHYAHLQRSVEDTESI